MHLVLVLTAAAAVSAIGTIDTVGWTFTDGMTFPASAMRSIERDHRYGTHVGWRMTDTFPGSAVRAWYNFVNLSGQHDPVGVEMSTPAPYNRWLCGIGVLPSGCAVGCFACNYPTVCLPLEASRDAAPGAGMFEMSTGPVGWWPVMAVTPNGWVQFVYWSYPPSDTMLYSRIETWPNWTNPVVIAPLLGEPLCPGLPYQKLVASSRTNRLVLLWLFADTMALRVSTDAGVSWGAACGLAVPAFSPGSETLAVFRGASGLFDENDSLHVVATVVPAVGDTLRHEVAEVWHYSPSTSPAWSRVRRAAPDSLLAPLEPYDDIADRVSIGGFGGAQGSGLIAVWQERTPSNREPLTDCLRSAVWFSTSTNLGITWSEPGPLTDTTSPASNCLPAIAEKTDERVWVSYIGDSLAGHSVGLPTWNPVIVHSIPVGGIAVRESGAAERAQRPTQTIVRGSLRLADGSSPSRLLDISGRNVLDLQTGPNDVSRLSPGVYFVLQASGVQRAAPGVTKVIVTR